MADYYIGQIFIDIYPKEAADWCNENDCYIDPIEPLNNHLRYEIFKIPPLTPEEYQEMINNLTMTALDFVSFIKSAGLTDTQIEIYLNQNLDVKHQLTFCQNVYCGVAKALMPITIGDITITAAMVEQAFKLKHGVK